MRKLAYLTLGMFVMVLALPSLSAAKTKVALKDAQGKDVGSIVIWDQGPGVGLELHLHDLTPGEHAIHFHEVPKCEAPDFKSAGGHFNPDSKKHGFDNPDGHHAGDMKNFTVGADGKASVRLEDKIYRTIEMYKAARQAQTVAERDAQRLRQQMEDREEELVTLRREAVRLKKEREEIRGRVEKMLEQIESIAEAS